MPKLFEMVDAIEVNFCIEALHTLTGSDEWVEVFLDEKLIELNEKITICFHLYDDVLFIDDLHALYASSCYAFGFNDIVFLAGIAAQNLRNVDFIVRHRRTVVCGFFCEGGKRKHDQARE